MDKASINQRFNESVNQLLENKILKNKADLAFKISIGASKLSEILNKRMSISLEDLALYCELFSVNANWILTGKGELFVKSDIGLSVVNDTSGEYGKTNIIELQRETILIQRKLITELERKIEKGKEKSA